MLDSALDKEGALWYQVQSKSSAQSWIASWLVQTSTAENSSDKPAGNHNDGTANNNNATNTENGVIANGTTVYVTGDVVNLRSGAGTNYSQLGQAVCGEALTVQGHSQDNDGKLWYQVPTEDGVTMWIASWLVSSRKPVGDGSSYTSTGVRTQLELGAVQRDGKKTVLSLKHGANNAYSVEKVNGTTLQLLLDNVTVGSDTQCQGNGFTLKASNAGNNKARITLTYPLGCYANIVQDGDWLLLNSYHTGSGLAGRTIVLDPGHGGSDPGSVSPIMPEVTDADVGYDVAVKLRAMLEQAGATVILTREDLRVIIQKYFWQNGWNSAIRRNRICLSVSMPTPPMKRKPQRAARGCMCITVKSTADSIFLKMWRIKFVLACEPPQANRPALRRIISMYCG